MDTVSLSTEAKNTELTLNSLRASGKVPCVLYGNNVENTQFQCEYNEIYKAYVTAGESTIVQLEVNGKKVPTLFHAVQFDPVSDKILHVDFYVVDMKKEIEAAVPIHFEGEALAVSDLGGVLVTTCDHVNVKCLPDNLPHAISVSLEPIVDFSASLHISDLKAPEGVTILDEDELMIATAQEPRRVEEVKTEEEGEESEEGAEGEDTEGEKKEGEGKEEEKKE
ncbi:MAG: 50S ribosomal protein L25 [Candidatus Peribacteraceae bacterium]|nr:50S ribosomal protein L25 [Candidatus Peribacteraceae bacterium]